MTTCKRGDVVLVKVVFADEKVVKRRPALIISSEHYHKGRREAVLAAITSHVARTLVGDYRLADWADAGLPLPSTVTGIVRTIKQDMIQRTLGSLSADDLAGVEAQVRASLAL